VTGACSTVGQALREARSKGLDRLDANLLLAHVTGRERGWVLAHEDAPLDAAQEALFRHVVARRSAGEPLAYIVGKKEFHGWTLAVDARVLVPRPDTETLVDWAVEWLGGLGAGLAAPRVLDLGTGSGAIAIAVKKAVPGARVRGVDLSADALELAVANARQLAADVDFIQGDWWKADPRDEYDLVLSNPPYVAASDPHLSGLAHEPRLALVAGADGLDAIRQIVLGARGHLATPGALLLEHGHDQGQAVRDLLQRAGFAGVSTRQDLGGRERCTGGFLPHV
jgi:release factor glutamine methyltransferase